MGVRFRKTFKIGNLLKINISKSGVSATVGKNGASVNIGSKGTYLNLSPTIAGITGTGLSYRQKLTSGYGGLLSNLLNRKKDKDKEEKEDKSEVVVEEKPAIDNSEIEEYLKDNELQVNIHKYADNVLNEEALKENIEKLDSDSAKEIYNLAMSGDEDTIETLVGSVLNNLELSYEVKANYELEDSILYVDLDLPEIENFSSEYPTEEKGKVVIKKKSQAQLKEEYGKTVISLGIFLVSNFFNVSSFIKTIVLSGFTTKRNNDGDLCDEYLYSVKFVREVFESTDFTKVDDVVSFINKFENRINVSSSYSFKAIKPYEMESQIKANALVEDAIAGLKALGYKAQDIDAILSKLNEAKYETSGDYLKYALSLLNNK